MTRQIWKNLYLYERNFGFHLVKPHLRSYSGDALVIVVTEAHTREDTFIPSGIWPANRSLFSLFFFFTSGRQICLNGGKQARHEKTYCPAAGLWTHRHGRFSNTPRDQTRRGDGRTFNVQKRQFYTHTLQGG